MFWKKRLVCPYNTADVPYGEMTPAMTTAGLTCSATITGLTNGSTTTRYVRGMSKDALLTEHPTTTSQTITVQVLGSAGDDTTAPSTVADLTATLQGSTAVLVWSVATDNVAVAAYQVYLSSDACVTTALAGAPVAATTTVVNLGPGTNYCFQVKAIDTSNNVSAAFSNSASVTTASMFDVDPPSNMANLRIVGIYTASMVLGWDAGTDTQSFVTSSMQQCVVVSGLTCTDFSVTQSRIATTVLSANLASNARYCFRGRHSDVAGNAGDYSATVCGTTSTSGLTRPRKVIPFGMSRLPRN